nr:hypothetical protein [Tanacetum cinerariifolium]
MKPGYTLLMGDEDSSTIPTRETDQFIESGADDLVPIPKESGETSNNDSECNMLDISLPTTNVREDNFVTFSNPLFDTSFIDEPPLLVISPPASKQSSLREVDRFAPFFSMTQSGRTTTMMETPSFGFYHMSSPRPAAYSSKEVMYRFYHPYHTSGDRFDHEGE